MKLWITGVNHRTAPVEVRERLAFPAQDLPLALEKLKRAPGLVEGLILSTCNRVEVAVTTDEGTDPRACVEEFFASTQNLSDRTWLQDYVYGYEGSDAIRHIFRVAASLDSMVVGEPQILGQLKTAYSLAKEAGSLNGFLDTVVTRAFSVAKRVRSETEIGVSAVSVSYAAVELAKEIFGSLNHRKVMLIGAGKMSELAARHLLRSGVGQVLVTNRTRSRAEVLAEMVRGKVIDYSEYLAKLPEADIVITSSGASGYILEKQQMQKIIGARKNRPMFLIDIAVPRNIEPAVNEIENVFLYDIDDLQRVVDTNLKERLNEAAEADKIVAEEVERLESWLRSRQVVPLIVTLQEQLEQMRTAELDRSRAKLAGLTPEQQEAVEALTKSIINKVAHGPIVELRKQAVAANGLPVIETISKIFRLDK